MDGVRLFRRRFIPDEIKELKDDKILKIGNGVIVTSWNVLKPRRDIARGVSAYFIDRGLKISKVYDHDDNLVYWYCDIIETIYDKDTSAYTFNDLLIDVLVFPDGRVQVVDMDEFADVLEAGTLSEHTVAMAMRQTDALLKIIYEGKFHELTKCILDVEGI